MKQAAVLEEESGRMLTSLNPEIRTRFRVFTQAAVMLISPTVG